MFKRKVKDSFRSSFLDWLRWPDQCRMISVGVDVAYRPGRVLELTISIEVWLHPEDKARSRLMKFEKFE